MKYDFSNPAIRLQQYWQLYQNIPIITEDGALSSSIEKITELSTYPRELVRRDIADLYYIDPKPDSKLIHVELSDCDNSSLPLAQKAIAAWSNKTTTYKNFISGKYDSLPLSLSHNDLNKIQIFLSDEEYAALEHISAQSEIDEGRTIPYIIKESYRYHQLTEEMYDKISNILIALKYKECVSITSTNKDKVNFLPLHITYDTTQNLYAVLGVTEDGPKIYRLYEITGKISNATKIIPFPKKDYFSHAPKVWGLDFFDPNPQKVKIRFYDEANVLYKVKGELENRLVPVKIGSKTYTGKLYSKKVGDDDCLYYEDIVYGMTAFKAWISGFGSSAIVEEPVSLRNEIVQSLKDRL